MSAEITRERSKVNFSLNDYDKIVSDGHNILIPNGCVIVIPSHTHTHTHARTHTHTHAHTHMHTRAHTHTHTHTHAHTHTMYVPLD